nr:immunoglobulin heavy chain junction region [Macaca mulatta]
CARELGYSNYDYW